MITPKENYLAHVIELRDAGKQLMHLFAETGHRSTTPEARQRIRRQFLETELYVLQLDELIGKMGKNSRPLASTSAA